MPYLLIVIVGVIMLVGVAKISRQAQTHGTPWGALMVWAVLVVSGILVWTVAARMH